MTPMKKMTEAATEASVMGTSSSVSKPPQVKFMPGRG